jgi:hypothetical protein
MAFIDFDGDRSIRMLRTDWGFEAFFEAFKVKFFHGFVAQFLAE